MDQQTVATIEAQLQQYPILLYMKGTPEQPMCGFSAQAVQALKACQAKFATIDILAQPEIRKTLPHYADWPTFPQLYIRGELIGGCDIMQDLLQSGELARLVKSVGE